MAHFIIENFANGLDLRRSRETAASGSLRVLRNAFINEGGEIEKRKAFVKEETVTAYGQDIRFKGNLTGPHEVPGHKNAVFFKHRHADLPSTGWTAGAGSLAKFFETGDEGQTLKFWAMKSAISAPNFGALFHGRSYSEYSNFGYLVESYLDSVTREFTFQHNYITFTDDEPTAEAAVVANAGRAFQMVLKTKGYVADGNTLHASAVGDPSDMAGTGSGSNDLTTQGTPIGGLEALADYFGQLVIFGSRGVQFYSVDPDFAANQYLRTVPISLFAPRTIQGYGDGDIFYLGRNGIRSLQARDSSNLARVSDAGSPIDRLLKEEIKYTGSETEAMFGAAPVYQNANYYNVATGIVNPDTGQFWLMLKDQIYVLSRHPSSKVLAWSSYSLPTPTAGNESTHSGILKSQWVADVCAINDTIIFRNYADEVFVYGGTNGETYDASEVEVILPFSDMGRPGTVKYFTGVDLVCEGVWAVEIATIFQGDEVEIQWERVAEIENTSRHFARIAFAVQGVQIALRLVSNSEYAARLSQVVIYYDGAAEK